MALSFNKSRRMAAANPVMTMEASVEAERPVVDSNDEIATLEADQVESDFTRSGNYTWFDTFSDNDYSTVDSGKDITLNPNQINITQENNSQVIPFEMPRYYDGVDLMQMTIQIHYVNADNNENYTAPVNVSYSNDKIRFYWMVSNYATAKEGTLKFEIIATGAITVPNSGESKNYLWRTRPNDKLTVLKALSGSGMTDPTGDDWYKDGQWHFYACGDFGNSKKNSDTMGMDPNNHKEVIVEIDNNTDAQTRFLSGDFSEETWDGDHSFEFRYINKACTEEEIQAAKDAWIRVQNWVVNADDEEFKKNFENYFVKDSTLFHYLFTERHTMVDNRAKNVFPHTTDLVHWDFCFDYDNDTAMGNDNEGGLTLSYGYEDMRPLSPFMLNVAESAITVVSA